jgi:uncharacterized protein YcbK (DUF882 family)
MADRTQKPHDVPRIARRQFLRQAGALCGVVGSLASPSVFASTVAATRSVRFVHTHTGESLTARYFEDGAYNQACLQQVDFLLRDFRTGEQHSIDPSLLDVLHELQRLADRDAAFEVISAYRSPRTNAMLHRRSNGVAEHSQHVLGKAIDIRLSGYPTRRLGEHARSMSRGGVGFYAASDFVHVDTGPVRFW